MGVGRSAVKAASPVLSDTMCSSIIFRKSTPPQDRQPSIYISDSKQSVDDFVGELTL